MALCHGDTAMDHGVVHRAPDAYGTQHRLGVEAGTHQLQTAAVDHKEVGALAHRQLADIVPAQQPGAAAGGHFQHVVAGGGPAAGVQAVEQEGHPQLLHKAGAVVRGAAVHGQSHGNAQLQHLRDPGDAGGELHVADGAVGHAGAGFGQHPQLTEKVRRHPYSVVLFDEIEKAHPDVWNILLQILEDGIVTDSQGRRVDFKNTIIVMTSNVGAKNITAAEKPLGFDGSDPDAQKDEAQSFARIREAVMTELRQTFRPEFLNRIDEIIVFRQLTEENIRSIARRMLDIIGGRMAQQGITLQADDDAVAALAKDGFDARYGARPLRRTLQTEVEDAVAEQMLEGKLQSGDTAHVCLKDGKVVIEK